MDIVAKIMVQLDPNDNIKCQGLQKPRFNGINLHKTFLVVCPNELISVKDKINVRLVYFFISLKKLVSKAMWASGWLLS